MNTTPDALIIGSGIIGTALAFEMAKKGYHTLNIDKLPASGYGSTSNSCAIIRFSYSTWEGVAMAYEGLHFWKDWEAYLEVKDPRGMALFHQTGILMMKDRGPHFEKVLKLYKELGVPYEVWNQQQILEVAPFLNFKSYWPVRRPDDPLFDQISDDTITTALWNPDGGYINDPQLSTHNLQVAAEAKGSQFIFDQKVIQILQANGSVTGVELEGGSRINAPIVINVAGPHSNIINQMAGVTSDMNVKTRALRHEVHHVPSPPDFNFGEKGKIMSDSDIGCYYRPSQGNSILIGSEDPECDRKEWIDDPDDYNRDVTDAQWHAQVLRLAKRIENLGIPNRNRGVVDLYDVADDWIPIYDRSDLNGFYMAIGTSGNQFKNAPIAAYLMTELIHACENGTNHDADPVQIKAPYTGKLLTSGFYSRKREINTNSSFSVKG